MRTEGSSEADVLEALRRALGDEGEVVFTPHADRRLRERGFDRSDVLNAIRTGKITRREVDMRFEERFTIEASSIDDPSKRIGIVCKLISWERLQAVVITAFDESTRYGRRRRRRR